MYTVNSLYNGHCRGLASVSSLARVRNSEISLFQSNICIFVLAAAHLSGVSVIAGCLQGES